MDNLKLDMIIWHDNKYHEYGIFVFYLDNDFYFVRIEYFVDNKEFQFSIKLLLKLNMD